ncbi:YolD-like family protein [Bacillus cereus group sp. BfR-BA-01309]|uniref:YolD-like family protein n=1 Tax=Bacillus cereus group sp. BfR-BA-01309 TaxID=2920286 RepID=UPI00281660F7|nr:YolD-like family protein [Bacillus cereus group sp. BfR-BA-01309]
MVVKLEEFFYDGGFSSNFRTSKIEEQYKVPKPHLTYDTQERIEQGLNESLQHNKKILISYYRNGYIHE